MIGEELHHISLLNANAPKEIDDGDEKHNRPERAIHQTAAEQRRQQTGINGMAHKAIGT